MEKIEKFSRAVLFSIFALVGILSVFLAVIGPEVKNLYKIRAATRQSEQNNAKIEQIANDHQDLINLINQDPNILSRLAPAELGENVRDPNNPIVAVTQKSLVQAKEVLDEMDTENQSASNENIPNWLLRATLKSSRIVLFISGASLMLISFVCFSGRKTEAFDKN